MENISKKTHERDLEEDLKDFLNGMTVSGFRGIQKCHIDFNSPITAISGVNGSGKSTFLHLAACSYHDAGKSKRVSKYVSDYSLLFRKLMNLSTLRRKWNSSTHTIKMDLIKSN